MPGVDFDRAGKRAVRFSHAHSEAKIREAGDEANGNTRGMGGYVDVENPNIQQLTGDSPIKCQLGWKFRGSGRSLERYPV